MPFFAAALQGLPRQRTIPRARPTTLPLGNGQFVLLEQPPDFHFEGSSDLLDCNQAQALTSAGLNVLVMLRRQSRLLSCRFLAESAKQPSAPDVFRGERAVISLLQLKVLACPLTPQD